MIGKKQQLSREALGTRSFTYTAGVSLDEEGIYELIVINDGITPAIGDITHLTDFQVYVVDRTEARITLVRAPGGQAFTHSGRAPATVLGWA